MGYFGWNNGGLKTQLLDSKMDHVNGFDYVSHKNEFGAASACYPLSEGGTNRFTEMWSISPLNITTYHGCSPFDCFGTQGVPARPDSDTSKWAMGVWNKNDNLQDPSLRLEHGIDVATIREWYNLGKKTWTFKSWFAALPHTAGSILDQNLESPSHVDLDFINWEPTTPPCAKNKIRYRVVDQSNTEIIPMTDLINYTVDANWHQLTGSFTLDSSHEKFFRQQGYPCWQFQFIFGNEAHIRHLIYSPTLT